MILCVSSCPYGSPRMSICILVINNNNSSQMITLFAAAGSNCGSRRRMIRSEKKYYLFSASLIDHNRPCYSLCVGFVRGTKILIKFKGCCYYPVEVIYLNFSVVKIRSCPGRWCFAPKGLSQFELVADHDQL